jgi:hypothetical protein
MRLGAGGECGNLLVSDMQPLHLSLPADGIRQAVRAVADDSVDAFHSRGGKCVHELVSDTSCHGYSPA